MGACCSAEAKEGQHVPTKAQPVVYAPPHISHAPPQPQHVVYQTGPVHGTPVMQGMHVSPGTAAGKEDNSRPQQQQPAMEQQQPVMVQGQQPMMVQHQPMMVQGHQQPMMVQQQPMYMPVQQQPVFVPVQQQPAVVQQGRTGPGVGTGLVAGMMIGRALRPRPVIVAPRRMGRRRC